MSIQYLIPKSSRLIQAKVIATALFNTPTLGKYDFNSAANKNLLLYSILPGHLYFLERVNIGGDISEANYQDAINTVVTCQYKTSAEKSLIFPQPLPVVNYVVNQELNTFIWTEKTNDTITVDVVGILNQTSDLVGVTDIRLFLSFNLYDITDTGYIAEFKGAKSKGSIGAPKAQVSIGNSFFVKD